MNYKKARTIAFWCGVAGGLIILILAVTTCTESQQVQLDEIAQQVEPVTEAGEEVLDSPAGVLVPPQYQAIIRLVGAVTLAIAGAWQEFRRRTAETALAEVVAGNEDSTKGSDFSQAQNATQSIRTRKKVAAIRSVLVA